MPLVLKYKAVTTVPVEIEGLVPNVVRGQSLAEIEQFQAFHGNRQIPLAELFDLSGDPSDGRMHFEGNLAGVHWIGAGMSAGEIHVAGPAGRHLGSEMTAGTIRVDGDASDWVGGELHGGLIHVRGRAGHLIGAAYRGSRLGMTGGTILIDGEVGNEIGLTMRRGLIAIGGGAGDAVGFNMIAGTILVFGPAGIRPGAGMRRGTIGLFGPSPPAMLPTYRYACRYQPVFLKRYLVELRRLGFPVPADCISSNYLRYSGDLLELGKGEILLRA